MKNLNEARYPDSCDSVGKKIEYLSAVLIPAGRFDEYLHLMSSVLDERIHYVDPVHELRGREAVLAMLGRYVPRANTNDFRFELVVDERSLAIWNWTIRLKIRFTPFRFTINGLVHAKIDAGKIIFQREYYDPMESIEVIPLFGKIYKLMLRMA